MTIAPFELVTRAAFRAWLECCPPYAIVGYARSACECPIAQYLEVLTGVKYAVTSDTARAPVWIIDFIYAVDRNDFDNSSVSAITALRYLANIP